MAATALVKDELDLTRSTAAPITAAAVLFVVCGLVTISVLYRLFRLFRGRHHAESGIKLLGFPAADVVLIAVCALILEVTTYGILVGQDCTEIARGVTEKRYLRKDTHIFNTSALSLQFLSKLPLYLSFSHAIGYFPPARWLKISVAIAPVYHIIAFIAALLLEIFSIGNQIGMMAFAVSTDLILLTISATLLLNPILLHLSLPIQRLLSAICYTIGVFSFAAGLIRFALTRPGITYDSAAPINLDLEERGLLWLSLQTAAVVIVGNCITFKDVVEDKKEEDATPAGPGAGAGVRPPPKREQIGVGVWRETKSKGKGSKRVESEAAGWG